MVTPKEIADVITAGAALFAAIASLVSALKSAKAKTEASAARELAQEIKTEVKTNVLTALNTVVRQTQVLQQAQNQNIHITVANTAGQGLAANAAIFPPRQPEPALPRQQVGPERKPEEL